MLQIKSSYGLNPWCDRSVGFTKVHVDTFGRLPAAIWSARLWRSCFSIISIWIAIDKRLAASRTYPSVIRAMEKALNQANAQGGRLLQTQGRLLIGTGRTSSFQECFGSMVDHAGKSI